MLRCWVRQGLFAACTLCRKLTPTNSRPSPMQRRNATSETSESWLLVWPWPAVGKKTDSRPKHHRLSRLSGIPQIPHLQLAPIYPRALRVVDMGITGDVPPMASSRFSGNPSDRPQSILYGPSFLTRLQVQHECRA
ncbi:hypothetical protein EDB80DRAFT_379084 [Ilyonectria destructans]|nr:hypothetical protein EDB80DRAFT_379084 [Ilyonectria destructans]